MARPIHLRSERTLARDVAALKRLQKAIEMDKRFGPELTRRSIQAINLTIAVLNELRLSI
jgi:hypothetical protein